MKLNLERRMKIRYLKKMELEGERLIENRKEDEERRK